MKVLIVLCATFAVIRAGLVPAGMGILYTAEAPILTQYHAQGEMGENFLKRIISRTLFVFGSYA